MPLERETVESLEAAAHTSDTRRPRETRGEAHSHAET